jgi:hypothetical protein
MPGVVNFTAKPGTAAADLLPGQAEGIYRQDPWDWVIVLPDEAPAPSGIYVCQLRPIRLAAGVTVGAPLAEVEIELDGQEIHGHLDQSETIGLAASWVWDIQSSETGYTLMGGKGKTFDDVARA